MSSLLFTSIIDFLPDATLVVDKKGKVIAWNKAIERMTGVKRADILGMGDYAYSIPFYGEKRPILIDLVQEQGSAEHLYDYVDRRGDAVYAETHVPTLNDGKGAYLWGTAGPLLDEDNTYQGAIESIRDITDRKLTEIALRRANKRYRTIFENAVEGIFQATPRGRYMNANPAYARMLGYDSPEELMETVTDMATQIFARPGQHGEMVSLIEEKEIIRAFEAEFQRKDGSTIWVSTNARAVRDARRKIVFYEGFTEDIHKRKISEAKLRKETRFNEILIQDSPAFFAAVSPEGKTLLMNRSLLRVLGYGADEVVGRDYLSSFVPRDEREIVSGIFHKMCIKKESTVDENHIVGKDGTGRLIEWHGRPVMDEKDEVEFFFGVGIDITERKQVEEALRAREAELEVNSRNLAELNTALKVLLKQREDDKAELEEKIFSNLKVLIFPYIEKLKKCRLEPGHMTYVGIVEEGLNDILSPFLQKMNSIFMHLTPTEVEIANLIKSGKRTKEIGDLLHISPGTVKFHRNNIRKKLRLNKDKTNLRSYLISLSRE